MVAQDIPFTYHPELKGVARERRWYMNGVSWANIVYLFKISMHMRAATRREAEHSTKVYRSPNNYHCMHVHNGGFSESVHFSP